MNKAFKSAYDKIILSDEKKNQLKDLYNIQEQEKEKSMRKFKIIKPVAAVAACLSLALLANFAIPNSAGKSKANNYFTLTAYAEELNSNNQSKYNESSTWGGGMCETENNGICYDFEFPVKCEGDNIDTITYSVNRGAFQITGKQEDIEAIQGEKSEDINTCGSQKVEDAKCVQYKSFTLKNNQPLSDSICLDIVDSTDNWTDEEKAQLTSVDMDDAFFGDNKESMKKLCDILVGNMDIKCTVKYNDGTTETKDIVVSNSIVKGSEIFKADEISPEDLESNQVIRTYSIKNKF